VVPPADAVTLFTAVAALLLRTLLLPLFRSSSSRRPRRKARAFALDVSRHVAVAALHLRLSRSYLPCRPNDNAASSSSSDALGLNVLRTLSHICRSDFFENFREFDAFLKCFIVFLSLTAFFLKLKKYFNFLEK
jgi:hypothetical protein